MNLWMQVLVNVQKRSLEMNHRKDKMNRGMYPRAIMVKQLNTAVSHRTVLGSQGSHDFATDT